MKPERAALLLGDLLVDVIMPIPEYPRAGGDGLANQIIVRPGGSVVNTACALANLGARARLLGRAGRDVWGDFEIDELRAAGVDVSAVVRDPQVPTGLSFIPVVPGGERTLFSYRGANNSLAPDDVSPQAFHGTGLLHLSGYAFLNTPQCDAALRALDLAKAAGVPVSLDLGVAPVQNEPELMAATVRAVDMCILGMQEARALTGQSTPEAAAADLHEWGIAWVALKLGPRGCLLLSREGSVAVPGVPVDPVDTTGAGDAFCAGLIYAHLAGLALRPAGLLACVMGGLATTVWGAGPGLPGQAAVSAYLRRLRVGGWQPDWSEVVVTLLEDAFGEPHA